MADETLPPGAATPPENDATRDGEAPLRGDGEPVPARLGRYHVLERLGAGGMGVVFAAYDPELDRKVAIKLLHRDRDRDSQVRLLREAQALARLSHPNVVQIHDAGALGPRIFLAMEFLRGADLRAWLTVARRSEADIVRVFVAAGRGLAAAHAQGLVHRDFKPENVLVGSDGRVCVVDFGLARAELEAPGLGTVGAALDVTLTATGALLGTPAYMSPEQHRGLPADARSDQFSFCVALWEALCGERPFGGDNVSATAAAVLAGQVRPPPADRRLPRRLLDLLRRGLHTDPERRFPDMDALLRALERDPARTRRRWLFGAVLFAMSVWTSSFIAERRAVEAEACSGGALKLAGVWDAERRAAVEAALRGHPDRDVVPRLLATLDTRAATWVAGHRDACLDHRRGEQSAALFDARLRCLEQRRQALARAVDLLVAPGLAPDPVQLIARLPADVCEDPDLADAEVIRPHDPTLARVVGELETQLIAARAKHHAGDEPGALAAVEVVIVATRRHELRPLLAEALMLHGHILTTLGSSAPARVAYAEAALHALATRRDVLAAEALARQVYLDGQLGKRTRALELVPFARAIAERLAAPAAALARLENNVGTLVAETGDIAAASAHFQRAATQLGATPDPDPLELAAYHENVAANAPDIEVRRSAFDRATSLLVGALGERHLITLRLQLRRAYSESDLEVGASLLDATCLRFAELHPDLGSLCGSCYHRLGLIRAELEHSDAARAAFARVPGCFRTAPSDPGWAGYGAAQRARAAAAIAILLAQPVEALAHADAALAFLEQHQSLWWIALEVAEVQLARGRALVALDRPPEAIAALDRAIALLTEIGQSRIDVLIPRWLATATALRAEAARALETTP